MPANKRRAAPISVRSGSFEFVKLNSEHRDWRDIYHWLLTLSWPHFSAVILGTYFGLNFFFALLYRFGDHAVAEMPANSMSTAFFFSVETLATVGYGHMYPNTLYGHVVATVEIMVGMFGMAVLTGLIFVRFARPTAALSFSRGLVIAPFDGLPTLMMRVANLRHQAMAEAQFRIMFLRNETTAEGEELRRFYTLPLQVEHVIMFPAAMTVRHTIDERSPLHNQTIEMLAMGDCRFVASINCIDTVIPARVQSQHDYSWREVRFGHRFVEIYTDGEDGKLIVDYGRLHDTEPVDELEAATETAG